MEALNARANGKPVPPDGPSADPGELQVRCPNCGRVLRVPPGSGAKGLGCKGCLHCYRYDYGTGTLTPLGHIAPPSDQHRKGSPPWRIIALALAIATALLLGWLLYLHTLPPAKVEDAAPRSTLDEIQRQLKSLTD